MIDNLEQQKGSSEKTLPILGTFQTANFQNNPFRIVVGAL